MIRCPECGEMLDSMSELAHHECEPINHTSEEIKRIRINKHKREDAERNARMLERSQREYEGV